MTAVTPPMNSDTGFLNTRHEMESGGRSADSPVGRKKSIERLVTGIQKRPRCSLQTALQRPRQDDRRVFGSEAHL